MLEGDEAQSSPMNGAKRGQNASAASTMMKNHAADRPAMGACGRWL